MTTKHTCNMKYHSLLVSNHASDQFKASNWRGIPRHIAVQAPNVESATRRAENFGWYRINSTSVYVANISDPRYYFVLHWGI